MMTGSLRLLAATLALVAVVGAGAMWYASETGPPPASAASPIPRFTPAPTALPSPSLVSSPSTDVVLGWLTTLENAPGVYSWDGDRCAGASCSVTSSGGLMHNCYGPCDVEIWIGVAAQDSIAAEATAVTIAGHSGWYRRVAEPEPPFAVSVSAYEEWIAEIDGVLVVIRLLEEAGTSDASLDDGHAMIDSLRTEPSTRSPHGFRLVFTITNRDWDSG